MQLKNRGTLATLCLGVLTACTAVANAQSWLPLPYQNDFVNHGRFSFTTGVLDTGGSRALLKRGNGVCINRLESDDTWTLEADIAAPEPDIDFGFQGCIDEDIAIVTAPGWVDDDGVERGRAYAYERDPKSGEWNLTYTFEPYDIDPDSAGLGGFTFGYRVSLDDGLAVITDKRALEDRGYARFFERTAPGTWVERNTFFGLADEDRFGASVDIQSGLVDLCAVGASQLEMPDANGTIEFFIRDESGNWVPQPDLLEGPGELGWPTDIDIAGGRMAVSASNQYGLPGIVEIWEGSEDEWNRRTTILGGGEEKGFFGSTVQLWTSKLLVTQVFTLGLPSDGAALLYESNDEGEWRITHAFNGALNFPSNSGCSARMIGDHVLVRTNDMVRDHIRDEYQYPPDPPRPGCTGDLNGDGIVDAGDLGLLIAAWGVCP